MITKKRASHYLLLNQLILGDNPLVPSATGYLEAKSIKSLKEKDVYAI